jgi:signal transduction histidine kinase
MTHAALPDRLRQLTSLRSRVAVLATLVALLTVVSAAAFVVVAINTEGAVTQQTQRHLADLAVALARGRASEADSGEDEALTTVTMSALSRDVGVEGGFYDGPSDRLIGYAFPTHGGPGVKRDIPPIERPIIEDIARRATQDGRPAASVFRGPRDVILFNAAPVIVGGAPIGSAWVMKRLPGLRAELSTGFNAGVGAFAAASLLCVGLAYALARGVRRGVARIEDRLEELERDLATPPARGFTGAQELARIHDGVNRLGESLRQRIASERTLRQTLAHKERLAAVGQVAAGVAHEVRNPLATIRLRTQMLGRASDDPGAQRSVAIVLEEVERLDQMVERLLYFSRPIVLRLRSIDASQLLRTSLAAMADAARAAHVDLTIDDEHGEHEESDDNEVNYGPPPLIADADRLRQVFDNVLQNALDATPPGGTVTARAARVDRDIVITIRDHGPGVADDVIARAFDPFFTTKSGGTGLGLSIAYEIIHAHDGQLTIEHAPGGGAMVTVRLPAAGPRQDASQATLATMPS